MNEIKKKKNERDFMKSRVSFLKSLHFMGELMIMLLMVVEMEKLN